MGIISTKNWHNAFAEASVIVSMGLADRLWNLEGQAKLPEVSLQVKTVINDITCICPQARILLFGSFANGTATLNSDLDLAIILPNEIDKKKFKKDFFRSRTRIKIPVDFIFRNEAEFLEQKNENPIDQKIHQEGVELHPQWRHS